MSLVLGLESVCPRKGCLWPWPRIFFVSLALASSLVSSTPPLLILVPLHFWLVPPHFICSGDSTASGPAPRKAFRGCASPNENCAPLCEDCAPKKVTGSVPLECSSRLETPKILIFTPEFVSKNCSFAGSAVKNFCFYGRHSRIQGIKVFVPPKKIIYASPVTLLWRQTFKFLSLFVALVGTNDADVTRGESR